MRTKRFITALLSLIMVACLVSAAWCQGKRVQLKLNLKQGQCFKLKMVSKNHMVFTPMSMSQTMDQTTEFDVTYAVQSVDAKGVADVKLTYDTIKAKMESSMASFEYDSAKPDNGKDNPMATMGLLAGKSIRMKIGPDGKIVSVTGMKAINDELSKKLAGTQEGQMLNQMGPAFSDNSIKDMMQQAFAAIYPDHPVGIGDTWTSKMSLTKPVVLNSATNMKLDAIQDGLVVISSTGKLSTDAKGGIMVMAGTKVKSFLSGRSNGLTKVDKESGMVTQAEANADISGKIIVSISPDGSQTMEAPLSAQTKMTMTCTAQ